MNSLLVAILLMASSSHAMTRKPRVDKTMESHGTYCNVEKPGYRLIMNVEQWESLWRDLRKPMPAGAQFKDRFAVAVFAGTRNSGGFGIVFDAAVSNPDEFLIRYIVTRPTGMAIMALTQPYAVRFFPKPPAGAKIVIEGREE